MTQHWSPIFNGNNGGVAGAHQQTTPLRGSASRQARTHSPPRRSAVRSAAAAAGGGGAFARPDADGGGGGFVGSSSFGTPTKGHRAAPQCSTSSYRSPCEHHRPSPTSVVAFDPRRAPPPRHRASSSRVVRSRLGVGAGGCYDGSPSPRRIAAPARYPPGGGGGGVVPPSPRCHPIAENKKYKTEMCKNMLENGYCRFGENCHYAHSEEERHSPSVEDLMKDDRLLLPCPIMVSTGFCPYDHRCKSLHDPRVVTFPKLGDEEGSNVVVLEHCTKAKRSGDTIPDRLYHRRLNAIRQVNPLVAPYVWENCRPSRSNDDAMEFRDTYDLVCNAGPDGANVFPSHYFGGGHNASSSLRASSIGGQHLYSDVLHENNPQQMSLNEFQKLCIVIRMRSRDDTHLDFIYAPKDCMNGQPCMVLQVRYFRLLDFAHLRQPTVSIDNIIAEIAPEVYHAGKVSQPNAFACAHEVSFDSKGKRSCNLSIWFDTMVTNCSSSKAKKMSKKDDPWRTDDASGSLFCVPNNEEFEASCPPVTSPYIFMQPIDDLDAGHDLVKSILEHRVASILYARGFYFRGERPSRLDQLGKDYARMKADLERWAWPKTSNRDHFSKTKEEQNRTVYSPSADVRHGTNSAIWRSFVMNLNGSVESFAAPTKRLPVFHSIMEKNEAIDDSLPHIRRVEAPRPNDDISRLSHPASLSEATWRELLLGEGEETPWKRTIESHMMIHRRNGARPPASPIVQNSISR